MKNNVREKIYTQATDGRFPVLNSWWINGFFYEVIKWIKWREEKKNGGEEKKKVFIVNSLRSTSPCEIES